MQQHPVPENSELSKIASLKQAVYDGKKTVIDFKIGPECAADLLKSITPAVSSAELRPGVIRHRLCYHLEKFALDCVLMIDEYVGFPALEWHFTLKNTGSNNSLPISQIRSMALDWQGAEDKLTPILHRSRGSDEHATDFLFSVEPLRDWRGHLSIKMNSGDSVSPALLQGADGRSSNAWLPFFVLGNGKEGLATAIGWSMRWQTAVVNSPENRVAIDIGLADFDSYLLPGEEIRSPLALYLAFNGDFDRGHNLLRCFIRDYLRPRHDGKIDEVPVCASSWGGMASVEHLKSIDRIVGEKLPFEYYWIDAGWYGDGDTPCPNVFVGDWHLKAGDWQVNRFRHPQGLRMISDKLHAAGLKFLLWVEPARAIYGTPVTLQHPEWFLTWDGKDFVRDQSVLLDLGKPEARQWAFDTLSKIIDENGVDLYREDFNFMSTLEALRQADAPGRRGMEEMRWVEGFYRLWDDLLQKFPRLIIDNCASGGRRIDLETIRRSLVLWRTDYNCFANLNCDALQSQTAGLARWGIPNSVSPACSAGDTYQFRSGMADGLVFSLDEFGNLDRPMSADNTAWLRRMLDDAKELRRHFAGDFYSLIDGGLNPDCWMSWQLHNPVTGEGAVMVFRRQESMMTNAALQLRALDADAEYFFRNADDGEVVGYAGQTLMDTGLTVALPPRASQLYFYRKG